MWVGASNETTSSVCCCCAGSARVGARRECLLIAKKGVCSKLHSQRASANITPSFFDSLFTNKFVDPANAPLPPSLPHHSQVHRHGAASCVSDLRYAISDLTLREAGRSALPTGAMNALRIPGAAASADVEMARTSIGILQPAPAQEEVVARSVAICVGRHVACASERARTTNSGEREGG